jgi:hypothetical protein
MIATLNEAFYSLLLPPISRPPQHMPAYAFSIPGAIIVYGGLSISYDLLIHLSQK